MTGVIFHDAVETSLNFIIVDFSRIYNHGQKCWDSYRIRTLFNTRDIVAARY